MIGMSQIYILVEYNEKWEKVDGGFWRWFGIGMSKGFVVDRSINFLELEETIYDRTNVDRNIIDLMFLYKEKRGMTLHVIIKEKYDKGKAIYVRGDDDLNSNGGDTLDFHDDYFGCRINEEISFVARFVPTKLLGSYEHPLQICATSTPINERITGFNPTPITGSNPTLEKTVLEEVANENDGVDKAGDDVPEGGDEVRKGCDGVPEGVLVTTPITPKREAILIRRFDEAGSLTPYQLNENEYIVMGGDFNACVNLTTRSCTCRVFDIDKIPCIHAITTAVVHYYKKYIIRWRLHDGSKEPSCNLRLYNTVPKNRRVKCLAEPLYTTVPKNRRVKSDFTLRFQGTVV
ncbi:hypothetical protein TIFTF001_026283 [Ficus carica]|uniref:SWIM-type domain-containing protein n=1 Tax=Ficus carica TaxID=3494 RepID=A0AA88DKY2_FICCA|nr:hypothetical protein TIFTF001_026283 [Ficus carica]